MAWVVGFVVGVVVVVVAVGRGLQRALLGGKAGFVLPVHAFRGGVPPSGQETVDVRVGPLLRFLPRVS